MYLAEINGKGGIRARLVEFSTNHTGTSIATFELRYPRWILAELNTHRVFSRSTASSRAIPVSKRCSDVKENPATPVSWGANKAGMQASDAPARDEKLMKSVWRRMGFNMAESVAELDKTHGLHKQHLNRLLEPWVFVDTVVTSTEWENFFQQRISPDAQPEIHELAVCMRKALTDAVPRWLYHGQMHLPYVTQVERLLLDPATAAACSVARCARVSYSNHGSGRADIAKDVGRHNELWRLHHLSPFEHVATPVKCTSMSLAWDVWSGNFRNWTQYRQWKSGTPDYVKVTTGMMETLWRAK